MAATMYSEQVELQSPRFSAVRTLQAVWMLLKHQRRYRRSLSELSRFNSRLLRDIGLAPQSLHWKDQRMASPPKRSECWNQNPSTMSDPPV
ncbi:uncharacterized protein YjiS (DUF1127 family) [Rhizobium aethiopicum]|uniref:Uncharacterized protein YjiS (DUF1127 family) n=1 Tax=Rhizobium aethiopicum TaxID=1138170 RepID=A0A7W6VQR8_9HYPH|nr:uncharacterized protein YjiS (DUF1127 family) [Rhizobium aethiopicum]MBB4581475.1 uncharacterized protein YjiS (DUF1127 family) [Rhizobium aethiopicum]